MRLIQKSPVSSFTSNLRSVFEILLFERIVYRKAIILLFHENHGWI